MFVPPSLDDHVANWPSRDGGGGLASRSNTSNNFDLQNVGQSEQQAQLERLEYARVANQSLWAHLVQEMVTAMENDHC